MEMSPGRESDRRCRGWACFIPVFRVGVDVLGGLQIRKPRLDSIVDADISGYVASYRKLYSPINFIS